MNTITTDKIEQYVSNALKNAHFSDLVAINNHYNMEWGGDPNNYIFAHIEDLIDEGVFSARDIFYRTYYGDLNSLEYVTFNGYGNLVNANVEHLTSIELVRWLIENYEDEIQSAYDAAEELDLLAIING